MSSCTENNYIYAFLLRYCFVIVTVLVQQVINGYMNLLKITVNRCATNHVFVFPSYLAVLWDNKRFDSWLYTKVKRLFFDVVTCSLLSRTSVIAEEQV